MGARPITRALAIDGFVPKVFTLSELNVKKEGGTIEPDGGVGTKSVPFPTSVKWFPLASIPTLTVISDSELLELAIGPDHTGSAAGVGVIVGVGEGFPGVLSDPVVKVQE